ncbi:MAG: HEAT repeat domain-containing protein, partial [Planctomycetota bacterium]
PLLIECTQQEDIVVIKGASMALARHDTPESAAALIALSQHENPKIRIRAAIDLGNGITQPGAIEALMVLLDDPDTEVRAMAPRRFVRWGSDAARPARWCQSWWKCWMMRIGRCAPKRPMHWVSIVRLRP